MICYRYRPNYCTLLNIRSIYYCVNQVNDNYSMFTCIIFLVNCSFGGFILRSVVSCWFNADRQACFIYRNMANVECYSVAIHAFGLAITCLAETVVMLCLVSK